MCLFLRPAPIGHKIDSFKCGTCPECLSDKSKIWALRCSFEAEKSPAMMLTLTYDNYIRDGRGNIIGEQLDTRPVSKRDCQLFIKRLRKYIDDHNPNKRKFIIIAEDEKLFKMRSRFRYLAKKYCTVKGISICELKEYLELRQTISERVAFIKNYNKNVKEYNKSLPRIKISYLLCAEYGKRTHRSHYHCIIFGYQFQDCIFYKRSKRGNVIYRSNTLEKIWHNGICTVDSLIVGAQVARYCTKYCAKDTRCDDTFMLFSRGIGDDGLHEHFNGRSYIIDGREYPIPRLVWQWYITKKYSQFKDLFTTKYVSLRTLMDKFEKDIGSMSPVYTDIFFQEFPLNSDERRNIYLKDPLDKRLIDFVWCHKYRSIFKQFRPLDTDFYYSAYRPFMAYYRYKKRSRFYRYLRDNDVVYKRYLQYWKNKIEQIKLTKPSEIERIRALPDSKYFMYKQKALANYNPYYSARCPRSGKTWYKWTFDWKSFGALPPCHKAPNDTKSIRMFGIPNVIYSRKLKKPVYLVELAE